MGLVEVIGILIFVIVMGIVFWKKGFRPGTDEFRKFRKETFDEFFGKESGDPDAYKKGFIVSGKFYKFSREDLSDEERAKEIASVTLDECFAGEEKDQRVK